MVVLVIAGITPADVPLTIGINLQTHVATLVQVCFDIRIDTA